ncbi:hypothetical protein HED49_23805 [Ochrobactrum daejeonense]|nr:hypothetical protein [Brucella daejeonensis]
MLGLCKWWVLAMLAGIARCAWLRSRPEGRPCTSLRAGAVLKASGRGHRPRPLARKFDPPPAARIEQGA